MASFQMAKAHTKWAIWDKSEGGHARRSKNANFSHKLMTGYPYPIPHPLKQDSIKVWKIIDQV